MSEGVLRVFQRCSEVVSRVFGGVPRVFRRYSGVGGLFQGCTGRVLGVFCGSSECVLKVFL